MRIRAVPLVIALGLPAIGLADSPAQLQTPLEIDVKATFVYQFTRYVDWPAGALPPAGAPFNVCVVAEPTLRDAIQRTIAGERVEGRPLTLVVPTPATARSCQILFIEARSMARGEPVLAVLQGASVLTVSDASEFAPNGGHIQLVTENNRVRFDLNQTAARASGLTLRSQLLRIARKILAPASEAP